MNSTCEKNKTEKNIDKAKTSAIEFLHLTGNALVELTNQQHLQPKKLKDQKSHLGGIYGFGTPDPGSQNQQTISDGRESRGTAPRTQVQLIRGWAGSISQAHAYIQLSIQDG
jgi:hypothetical protein